MMRFIKRISEGTFPATAYRMLREEWRFMRQKPGKTPYGYCLAGPPHMRAGTFEPQEHAIIRECLVSADLFVDIGANIGSFSCLARSMGKQIIAVEPIPNNLRYLYANLQANDWADEVEVYPVALANKPGLAVIYGASTGASLVCGWAGTSSRFSQTIPCSTLDVLLGDRFNGKRIVIKMDVEGAEYAALVGASKLLHARPRPTWLVEITLTEHRQGAHNPNFLKTFEIFWDCGYKAAVAVERGRIVSRSEIHEYANTGIRPSWVTGNYLFTYDGD